MGNATALAYAPAANLPAAYEQAKAALATCESVDECQQWANKAAALASYARQSKDDTLIILAQRIQARAIRRCGELLQQVPELRGVRTPGKAAEGRTAKAREAGLSPYQQAVAMRVAAVPKADFEQQVESTKPPSITQLSGSNYGQRRSQRGCCPTCGRAYE